MIPPDRLQAIETMCTAFGLSLAEQRELVRGYREMQQLREALKRARDWGGLGRDYDGNVRADLERWIDAGMSGPLPPMPHYHTQLLPETAAPTTQYTEGG